MKNTLKYVWLTLLTYFPRSMPTGMTAFDAWSSRIIATVGPMADEDSMRFALASQLMHLGPQAAVKPDRYFVLSLRKAAANQVASQVFQDIKTKQKQANDAALEATKTVAASNVTQ